MERIRENNYLDITGVASKVYHNLSPTPLVEETLRRNGGQLMTARLESWQIYSMKNLLNSW